MFNQSSLVRHAPLVLWSSDHSPPPPPPPPRSISPASCDVITRSWSRVGSRLTLSIYDQCALIHRVFSKLKQHLFCSDPDWPHLATLEAELLGGADRRRHQGARRDSQTQRGVLLVSCGRQF